VNCPPLCDVSAPKFEGEQERRRIEEQDKPLESPTPRLDKVVYGIIAVGIAILFVLAPKGGDPRLSPNPAGFPASGGAGDGA
jgi:hypothetical protein